MFQIGHSPRLIALYILPLSAFCRYIFSTLVDIGPVDIIYTIEYLLALDRLVADIAVQKSCY